MTEEKKKGILSKLFGAKKSCCGNVQIVEVIEEEEKERGDKSQAQPTSSCCDKRPKGND
jgi:hypothetical protein